MKQNEIVVMKLNLLLDDLSMYKKLIKNLISSINREEMVQNDMEKLLYRSDTEYIGKRIKEISEELRKR